MNCIDIVIPVHTISESNHGKGWQARGRRAKSQRGTVGLVVASKQTQPMRDALASGRAVVITLTRIAPRSLDDDNLRGALKACRDGVADALFPEFKQARRDNHKGLTWDYAQERGKVREYAVRVTVRIVETEAELKKLNLGHGVVASFGPGTFVVDSAEEDARKEKFAKSLEATWNEVLP